MASAKGSSQPCSQAPRSSFSSRQMLSFIQVETKHVTGQCTCHTRALVYVTSLQVTHDLLELSHSITDKTD